MKKSLKVISVSGIIAIAMSVAATGIIGSAESTNTNTAVSETAALKNVRVTPEMITEHEKYVRVYSSALGEAFYDELEKNESFVETWEDEILQAMDEYHRTGDREAFENNAYVKIADPTADVMGKAETRAREACAAQGLDSVIKLEQDELNRWVGSFTVDSIENTKLTFTDPHRFDVTVGNRTGTMTGKNGYSKNYKRVTVYLTYSNGVTKEMTLESTSSPFSVTAPAVSGAYLTRAAYIFYLYDNAEVADGLLESAVINLYRA